jgi:hypothetical protein
MITLKLQPVVNNVPLSWFIPVDPIDGIEKLEITLAIDESGHEVATVSSDLTFTGNEFNIIKQYLIDDPTSLINYINVELTDDCCDYVKQFRIKPDSLEWCKNSCSITARLTEPKEKYDCLESTFIWDDWNGFISGAGTRKDFPRFAYCTSIRPVYIQYFIMFFVMILQVILIILTPIVAVVCVIISAICGIVSVLAAVGIVANPCPPHLANGILDDYIDIMNNLTDEATGCGHKHPSPLVVQYLNNVCGKCGLTLSSTIFQTAPYNNLAYLNADAIKGIPEPDNTTYWIDKNRPVKTGKMLLDEMNTVFNGRWKIVGTQVVFEHKSYWQNQAPWLDMTDPSQITEDKIIKECYSWGKDKPAFGKFEYQIEGVDFIANESKDRYNDIVEWNVPYSPLQKGSFDHSLMFNGSRFRNDGITDDVSMFDFYNWPFFNANFVKYFHALILNHGTSICPKLLIWEPLSGTENAYVNHSNPNPLPLGVGVDQAFNFPMWFKFGYSWANPVNKNLAFFWECENPRNQNRLGYDYESEIIYSCDILNAIDINGTIQTFINNLNHNVEISEIVINFAKRTLRIRGNV